MHGDRLFDQDMDAAGKAVDADRGMVVVRGGDDHSVQLSTRQHRAVIGVSRNAILRGGSGRAFLDDIT